MGTPRDWKSQAHTSAGTCMVAISCTHAVHAGTHLSVHVHTGTDVSLLLRSTENIINEICCSWPFNIIFLFSNLASNQTFLLL